MQLQADLALKSAIDTLTRVVQPALGADETVAAEQLEMVVGLLSVLHKRLPLLYRFQCEELERALGLGDALAALLDESLSAEERTGLDAARAKAARELGRAQTGPNRVQAATRALRAMTAELVRTRYAAASAAERAALRQAVLDYSDDQLLRDRAWVAAQDWEATELPSVESLLFE